MRTAVSGVLIAAALGSFALAPTGHAQPATTEVDRAKDLYLAAEQAMKDGRFDDALRDYGGAYELTRDPVLFYKIGAANERAGRCDVALTYYRRYVDEARPTGAHLELVRERMIACGGDPDAPTAIDPARPEPPAEDRGDARPGDTTGGATGGPERPTPPSAAPAEVAATAPATPAPPPPPIALGRHRGPWLLVTGSLAFVTIGAVLAYSAESAENDIADLYVGIGGKPAVFDARTRATYEDLVDEGRRYEKLAWVSFGLAALSAVGATVWFLTSDDEPAVRIAPAVSRDGGGVSATLRF